LSDDWKLRLTLFNLDYVEKVRKDSSGRPLLIRTSASGLFSKPRSEKYPELNLFCRDENLKRVHLRVSDFEPRFFVPMDFPFHSSLTKKIELAKKPDGSPLLSYDGQYLQRVTTYLPKEVGALRRQLEKRKSQIPFYQRTYQGDILFPLVFMIDKGIMKGIEVKDGRIYPTEVPYVPPRVWLLDIENLYKGGIFNPEKPGEICIIGLWDSYEREYTQFYSLKNVNQEECETQLEVESQFLSKLEEVLMEEPKKLNLISCKSEKDLLTKFISLINAKDPDLIITFSPYDFVTIGKRLKKNFLNPERLSPLGRAYERNNIFYIAGRTILDLQLMVEKAMLKAPKWATLEETAKLFDIPYGQIHMPNYYQVWWDDPIQFLSRNLRDVELMREVDARGNLVLHFDSIRETAGVRFEDAIHGSRVAQIMYLRMAKDEVVLPSKVPHAKKSYIGGVVLDIAPGTYDYVSIFDFREMYPSLMDSLNISWDTWAGTLPSKGEEDIIAIDEDHKFLRFRKGWTPRLLSQLRPLRASLRSRIKELRKEGGREDEIRILDARQKALKSLVNLAYGVYGYSGDIERRSPGFFLYAKEIAESITIAARKMILGFIDFEREKRGLKPIFSDTDSTAYPNITIEGALELLPALQDDLRDLVKSIYGIETDGIEIGLDKVYRRLLIVTKKRYTGILEYDGGVIPEKIDYTGLECIRKDSSDLTVHLQKRIIDLILHDASKEEVIMEVINAISNLENGIYDWPYFALPRKSSGTASIDPFPPPKTWDKWKKIAESNHPDSEKYRKRIGEFERGERIWGRVPFHIKALQYSSQNLGLDPNVVLDRYYVMYVKDVPGDLPPTPYIALAPSSEFPEGFTIDSEKMVELTISSPIRDIVELYGIDWEEEIIQSLQKGGEGKDGKVDSWSEAKG